MDNFYSQVHMSPTRKHNIDKPNVLIRIHSDGLVLYSVRLSLVLSCPMSLEFYPLDHQTCLIELASYAYTTNDIKYEWKNETPVQQKEGLRKSLPSFELEDVLTGYCTSKTNTGEYSCLKTELVLRREFSYYLLQLYIPSFMLVIVSWVSFWLDKDSVPARVTLGVTTLLTMTTQSSGINAKLPPVSYTKAIDVWIGVCLAFIFGALLEFALVNYAARKDMLEPIAQRTRRSNRPKPILPVTYDSNSSFNAPVISQGQSMRVADVIADYSGTYVVNNNNNNNGGSQIGPTGQQHSLLERHRSGERQKRHKRRRRGWWENIFAKYKERSKRIDVISRLFFPVGFFIFNCIYWTVYMSK